MKKSISLFLVYSILNISCATISPTSAEIGPKKKGADLIIQKTDGIQVRGWLIAVKENSLLLMERDSGADVSVDVINIRTIIHVRKSKGLKVVGISLASCLVVFTGTIIWADVFGPPELAEQGPIGLGLVAGLIGFIAGEFLVKNKKTYQIEGISDSEIQEILEKLRKKAKIKNFE
jgi:hypothetical protein